ncbi:hypothetical protein [Lacipirellula sp.]|uniref:hypothetical protein n=1 Tax=Lacipirellula sp. TaxID=2691419 RepID=UPI003D11DF0C
MLNEVQSAVQHFREFRRFKQCPGVVGMVLKHEHLVAVDRRRSPIAKPLASEMNIDEVRI